METIEDIGFGGLKLVQSSDGFRFGVDAVILADFASGFCPTAKRAVDLGTGNGVIPFIMSHKIPGCRITGVDVQQEALRLAERSCEINGLEERIDFTLCDVAEIPDELSRLKGACDLVVSNPPYVAKGGGIVNDADSKFISRQETTAGIEEFTAAAAYLLGSRGHLLLVHRPSRLVDIFCSCRNHGLEPKDIRFVAPREGSKPNIVLVHCVKGGGRELNILDELYVYEDSGSYSREILDIYEKTG